MCLDCGCHQAGIDHGDERHLTLDDLACAAEASGITITQAAENILATVRMVTGFISAAAAEVADDGPSLQVCKTVPEQRFLLGVAYQAGADPRIAKGADGGRDFFTPSELEKAAWSFMRSGPRVGAFHLDGTEGAAEPVESFIWRFPDWDAGNGVVVKSGDWLIGSVLDERSWDLYKRGLIGGYSPQGTARRRTSAPMLRGDS